MKDPPPKVYLKGFGDSAIDFELLVWIDKPHDHQQIRSDINYEIERLFREHEIEIPFPQRDLHLRSSSIEIAQNGSSMQFVEANENQKKTSDARKR
jgi:small-conductance mechanosensitive channel